MILAYIILFFSVAAVAVVSQEDISVQDRGTITNTGRWDFAHDMHMVVS